MDKTKAAWEYLKKYQLAIKPILEVEIEKELKQAQKIGKVPKLALKHLGRLMHKGKKIRGAFSVLGYEIGGGSWNKSILKASLAMEILHTSLLIHDDIMDQDETRRGLDSMHVFLTHYAKQTDPLWFGVSNAITIGDMGFYWAWQKLLESGFKPATLIKAAQIYTDYVIRVAYGQMLDVSNVYGGDNDKEEILKIFKFKTAEYTGVLPLVLGFVLSGNKDEKIKQLLIKYGLAFGWIFQIQDDMLGVFGDQQKLGKPIGSDLAQAKNTLLVWYVENKADVKYKKELGQFMGLSKYSQKDIKTVQEIFKQSGAYDYAVDLMDKYLHQGLSLIPQITPNKQWQQTLESFLWLAWKRGR